MFLRNTLLSKFLIIITLLWIIKKQLKKLLKKTEFNITEKKCFSYIQGKKTVGISQTYEGEPIRVPVLKKMEIWKI